MRQSLSAITFSFFSQAVLRSFTIAHIHTYFSSFLSYRNFWRSNTIHWSQQVIRSRGSVTDILSGVISSPRILLREIYPNYDIPPRPSTGYHPRLRDRFHLRDITHDSSWARVYLGREFPLPPDLYKYPWSMNKETPSSFYSSLFSYFGIPLVTV